MNEKRNHFQQYLPQTEVAATAEIAAGLKTAPQSLETVWDAVPCIQEAAAPIKKRACLRPFIYYVCTKGGGRGTLHESPEICTGQNRSPILC